MIFVFVFKKQINKIEQYNSVQIYAKFDDLRVAVPTRIEVVRRRTTPTAANRMSLDDDAADDVEFVRDDTLESALRLDRLDRALEKLLH